MIQVALLRVGHQENQPRRWAISERWQQDGEAGSAIHTRGSGCARESEPVPPDAIEQVAGKRSHAMMGQVVSNRPRPLRIGALGEMGCNKKPDDAEAPPH